MMRNTTNTVFGGIRVWIPVVLIFSFVLAFAISGLNPFKKKVEPFVPLDEYISHLDKQIPELMDFYNIPGSSIAIVKEGKIVWSEAYGSADVEKGIKLTKDTPMRVQSISKSVTAWGIMKLAEQGKIELDAPVMNYINSWHFPESGFSAEQATVRQLLSHTGGLPLGDVFTIYSPHEEMPSLREKLTKEAILVREPGSAFSYSNTGYNLLELLIEEVTGQPFDEYMKQEILNSLGMNHSTFSWNDRFDPKPPVGYDLNGKPVPVYVYPEKASGGLFSTAEDIAAFTIAGMRDISHDEQVLNFNTQVLNYNTIEAMYTPVKKEIGIYNLVFDAYGLGHYIETLPNGKKAISHGGQGTGIMTHFHAVPETGDAIVILTNSQRSWPFISYLLRDWARWRGFESTGMGRIIWGQYLLWFIIALIWSAVILQIMKLTPWIMTRNHKDIQEARHSKLRITTQIVVALIIIFILIWCLSRKYLFLSSVFPIASQWLGISAFVLSISLLFGAWKGRKENLQRIERKENPQRKESKENTQRKESKENTQRYEAEGR
ncbi:MAG TPA: beta-lactamase family protein [Clostridiales bacterium]|nr:beta-lactamase family protein [Clostridiales bacterium]